jgi:hypothetical protein
LEVKVLACDVELLITYPEGVEVFLQSKSVQTSSISSQSTLTSKGSAIVFTLPLQNAPSMYTRACLFSGAIVTSASSLVDDKIELITHAVSISFDLPLIFSDLLRIFHAQNVIVAGEVKESNLSSAKQFD